VAELILQIKLTGKFSIKNQIAILKKGISLCAVEIWLKSALSGLYRIKQKICHKGTKQNRLRKVFFESWYPSGENALRQILVDPTLESTKQIPATPGITTE